MCALGMHSKRMQTEWNYHWTAVFMLVQQKNYRVWREPHAQTVVWSHDMEGHAQIRVERYCKLANKKVEQLYKISHLCLDDHQFKQEELASVGELSEVCSQIVFKCLYLARIGRPDTLSSVNMLLRSVTNWTQACDKRLATVDFNFSSHKQFPAKL